MIYFCTLYIMADKKRVKKRKINRKQREFCLLYRGKYRGNASEAYAEAYGVKPSVAAPSACKLLKKDNIREFLQAEDEARIKRLQADGDRLMSELVKIAQINPLSIIQWKNNELTLKDSREIPEEIGAAIAEISNTREGIKIKFHPKISAIKILLELLGLFNVSEDTDEGEISKLLRDLAKAETNT